MQKDQQPDSSQQQLVLEGHCVISPNAREKTNKLLGPWTML